MASVVDSGNGGGGGGGRVVMELSHIKDLVRQLEGHLGDDWQAQEVCRSLASQISSLTDRSITLVTSYYSLDAGRKRCAAASPLISDASDAPFKTAKKRKTTDKVKNQVRVSAAGGGGDIPADDGLSWRKYGQKEILGAKYPRSYYRCTHRHSQGCAATKQVQRADEDPTLFDVVYLGAHTCVQSGAAAGEAAATAVPQPPERNTNAHRLLQSMSSSLTVKTEGLAAAAPEPPQQVRSAATTTPFCLSSTPGSGCLAEVSPFSAPSTASENCGASPATSDSANQHAAVSFPPFEVVAAAGNVEFEFAEVVSALVADDDDFDISSFFA